MTDAPVKAKRIRPGEYLLATDHVETGMRFVYYDSVYEITGVPRRWGAAWVAAVTFIEDGERGATFQAMLHTTEAGNNG